MRRRRRRLWPRSAGHPCGEEQREEEYSDKDARVRVRVSAWATSYQQEQ